MTRIDPIVLRELKGCGQPWSLDPHRRHVLVRVGGTVVSKLPIGHASGFGRAAMNVRSAIRKHARDLREDKK